MRIIVCALALASASAAFAQPYVARGEFNGWGGGGDVALNPVGGGKYSGTVTGQTPGQGYEYKATTTDWSYSAPSSNGRVPANAAGEIAFNFFPNNSWSDGWFPDTKPRVGYEDPLQFSWELVGDMNGWNGGTTLAAQGNGLYAANLVMNAGSYQFKFRKVGDWGYSIGDDFGNAAANNSVTVANNGDTIRFDLDLPNGRWTVNTIPEPASLALLALGGLLAIRRR